MCLNQSHGLRSRVCKEQIVLDILCGMKRYFVGYNLITTCFFQILKKKNIFEQFFTINFWIMKRPFSLWFPYPMTIYAVTQTYLHLHLVQMRFAIT